MNRRLGTSAGVIAIAAFVVHMAAPGGRESEGPEQASEAQSVKETDKARPINGTATNATAKVAREPTLEGPWLATRTFFRTLNNPAIPARANGPIDFGVSQEVRDCALDKTGRANCSSMLASYFGIDREKLPPVQFILAIVPDPLHTRLSLFTDSSIRAIQKAAADANWRFATQWLPWIDPADLDQKDPKKRTEDREFVRNRERQPGLLVFRRLDGPQVLMVFVAGETPTAGVDPSEFQNARAYMKAIQEPQEIAVQGPTFSGSLYSLARLIDEDRTEPASPPYVVRSGSVTSNSAIAEFRTHNRDFASANSRFSFEQVLTDLRIPTNTAAILVEDETEYGASAVAVTHNPATEIRTFRFPRDISHLRNAYREATQTTNTGATPAPVLDFSLKDNNTGDDSIPTFSRTQTPLAQSAIIDEITRTIERDGIRIVQLDASNVLDLLFLARLLKRQCPDTRLLISRPDLLFVQAAHSDALTGTLALSNYPMFMASNDWMGQKLVPAVFSDSNSEGVYNATMLLLGRNLSVADRAKLPADYHWRENGREVNRAPTWLLALDRGGFVPVRVWAGDQGAFEGVNSPLSPTLLLPSPPPLWTLISTVTAFVSFGLLIWVILLSRRDSLMTNVAFVPHTIGAEPDGKRLLFLFLLAGLLSAIAAVICMPLWVNHMGWQLLLPALGLLSAAICAGVALRGIAALSLKDAVIGIILYFAIPVWWYLCCSRHDDQTFFFMFRAMELRIGTSPAWPILAGLGVLLCFSFAHLTRLYLAVYEKPEIILDGIETLLLPQIQFSCNRFNKCAESAVGLWKRQHWIGAGTVTCSLLVLFAVARMDIQLGSIDSRFYTALSITLTLAAISVLFLGCWQVLALWHSLQGFLSSLNTLPLGTAFVQPDHSGSNRPIWVRRLGLQSIDIHAKSLTVLHDITILDPGWTDGAQWLEIYRKLIQRLVDTVNPPSRLEAWKIRQTLRRISGDIAIEAFRVAHDKWLSNSLVSHSGSLAAAETQPAGRNGILEIGGNPKSIADLAETFVAVHYSPFIIYGVRQIRNLMLFLSVGFVFLVVAVNSYSHQSPRLIGRLLLVLFGLIAAASWTCLTGMERDPIISRLAGTTPNKLTVESYVRAIAYGALPVLGLLASQFPSISNFLYSWLAPTLQAIH